MHSIRDDLNVDDAMNLVPGELECIDAVLGKQKMNGLILGSGKRPMVDLQVLGALGLLPL